MKLWMSDWPGLGPSGPATLEEPLEVGETLRSLLTRLAERMPQFRETIFNPLTQSISDEVALVINDRLQSSSLAMEIRLQDGDQILFFPYLAGG